jgi:hypothetical protein
MIQEMIDIRDRQLALEVCKGENVTDAARKFGLSPTGGSRALKKDRNRAIIKEETEKLLKLVPDITKQIRDDIEFSARLGEFMRDPSKYPEAMNTILSDPKDMLKFQELAYKKQQDLMKAIGIFPSSSTNVFIQQIYNDNRAQVLSPEIFAALGGMFTAASEEEEDIEDAEIINNTEETEYGEEEAGEEGSESSGESNDRNRVEEEYEEEKGE